MALSLTDLVPKEARTIIADPVGGCGGKKPSPLTGMNAIPAERKQRGSAPLVPLSMWRTGFIGNRELAHELGWRISRRGS